MEDIKREKSQKKKRIFWIAVTIAINLVIVGYIAVREIRVNADGIRAIPLYRIKFLYLGLGIACLLAAIFAEYRKYRKMIMTCEGKLDREGALCCALLGKYYDNITPFGAGGQPFQIHFLHKRGMSSGTGSAVPIAGFLTQQLAFVVIAAVIFIANRTVIGDIALIRYTAYVGLLMYLIVPLMLLFFALTPKPFKAMIGGVTRLLEKTHILKDGKSSAEKLFSSLDEYILSLKTMGRRPLLLISLMMLSVIYQAAILSVPFFMIRAFGGSGDWWMIFSITVYIYAAITIIPTPGNSGAAEGSFYAVFSSLRGGFLFWAMIVWRIIVYFSWIIIGIIVVTRTAVTNGKRRKKVVPKSGSLRVALFIDIFYPNIDGVIKTVDAYANEITKSGGYACVFCPKGPKRGYIDDMPYDVVRTPAICLGKFNASAGLPIIQRKLKKVFREKQFDIIHTHSPFGAGLIGVKLGRKFNIPVVGTFHSKYYDDALNITHNKVAARIVANSVVNFFCMVDRTWACSKSTAETLRNYGYNGRIDVIENGVEPLPAGSPDEMAKRAVNELCIPNDKHILLFVGQQIWQKNLKTVLDATKIASEKRDDVVTVVVGTGYNEEEIKKYALSIGVGDRVIFTGVISDRELLAGIYFISDLFFFPSMYDNAPIVLREAALAGVPALLSRGSSAAEIVIDGYNGYTEENNAEAMSKRILSIIGTDDIKAVGKNAKATIPVPWSVIVARATEEYRKI